MRDSRTICGTNAEPYAGPADRTEHERTKQESLK